MVDVYTYEATRTEQRQGTGTTLKQQRALMKAARRPWARIPSAPAVCCHPLAPARPWAPSARQQGLERAEEFDVSELAGGSEGDHEGREEEDSPEDSPEDDEEDEGAVEVEHLETARPDTSCQAFRRQIWNSGVTKQGAKRETG
eukprot:3933432-Rhodomonas_salina.1